ncbi:signal transduction histidine kinase [Falsibacillus pallidus]|uniref:histidine kinase n=1 Tax=Falsibacillus pallidus TaxID=493781 RepID=A0A370GVB9_9BACI|nr:signal transduction histidine kinase [Falsibacillus pallidus]
MRIKKISIKISLYFLIATLLIEGILFFSLYTNLVQSRVNEEINALLARGNSHRDVLQKNFDSTTVKHVALMESEGSTSVIITSSTRETIAQSKKVTDGMKNHLLHEMPIPHKGSVIEKHWKTSEYICTVSPIKINNQVKGYVYMFLGTGSIKSLINHLTHQFLISGAIILAVTIITMIGLSKLIATPLVHMKEAAQKMSSGDLTVSLNVKGYDEIGELSNAIQQLANDLKFMKNERSEFLASVAHELRTPLTFVKGYADIAMRESITVEERNNYLSIIKEESEHITDLVKNLFDLAQMEKHSFQITKLRCNLYDLSAKTIDRLRPAYKNKNIKLSFTCPKNLFAQIDQQRFEQVLINLLNNSYRHAYEGSTISVIIQPLSNFIQIEVKDEGEGIPPEDVPYIFNRFYRVDKSRTRSTGGIGLGLAIVKEIIELHNGSIYASSILSKGTTISIQLPIE